MCNAWCLEFAKLAVPYVGISEKILEVGSRDVNGSTRKIFAEHSTTYVGVDIFDGPGVDKILDVKDLIKSFGYESFDVVTSTEMLEHCSNWQTALYQMAGVLCPGGLLLVTTRSPGFELHDYPADHWRFSYSDFEEIFQPLGDIIAIQSDMTLGWPCGIGILVKRKLDQSKLSEWKTWLDTFTVYSMENEVAQANPPVKSQVETMVFDQYSRYMACSDLLRQTGFASGNSVLDIGSGPECLFGQFLPEATMNYVDPLIPFGSGQGRITGNVFAKELEGQTFDCVSAVDVLEHVPPEHRHAFLERMSSLGKNTLILGFPTSDSSDALETDKAIDAQYRSIYGHDYSWLEEHYRFGLPSLSETVKQLSQQGWHCQTVGHGHTPWLKELLGFVICVWDIPSMKDVVLEISKKFNHELYQYDFRAPYYRQFVIATRSPLPPITTPVTSANNVEAENIFRSIIEDAHRQYFAASLRQLVERDTHIVDLNQKIEEASSWGKSLHAKVVERDAYIANLNQQVEEVSTWAESLQATVVERDTKIATQQEKIVALEQARTDKHAELMKMSDWAYAMMQERNHLKVLLTVWFINTFTRIKSRVRARLARSYFGSIVRYMRDTRQYRDNMVSLEALRESLANSNGRLIITFPIITWDFRWQRPQHIVTRLRDQGFAVVYLAMTLTPLSRRFRGLKEAGAYLRFNKLAKNIDQIWLHSAKQINIYNDPVEGDDLYNLTLGLETLIRELKPKSIHYLLQFPGWWPIAKDLRERLGGKVIFDCMDDHSGFSTNTTQALKTEHDLIAQADLVITSSAVLDDRCKSINTKTIQVKNGTEFDHFHNPKKNGVLDHLSNRPIIGYYGAISDWFDMTIVAHCARHRPDWNFVLIGSTFGADLQTIAGLKNVHLLGEIPYKELPGYFAYFDVCTIPFKMIPLTLATNPVKFYEYLSAGKPVVSIDLPELRAYRKDCYLARNSDEFLAQIDQAYNERNDEQKIERRIELARNNSWDARISTILESEIFKTNLVKI